MADQNDFDRRQWDNAQGVSRRSHDTRQYGADAMGPEDYAFDDQEERYDGRQGYYRSRAAGQTGQTAQVRGRQAQMRGEERTDRGGQGAGQRQSSRADQDWRNERMADQQNDDWAQQVRQNWQRGPYRDYGWESGESALPEFRDPGVHRTREEEQEDQDWQRRQGGRPGRRGYEPGGERPDFRRAYDAQNARGLPTGEEERRFTGGPEYGRNAWNVPGPHRGRGPRNYQRSNERIREDINERLTEHGQIDATNIDVRVENGEVWLTGSVDSRQAKRMAEDVADSVTGVKDIHNELKIQQEHPQAAG